jgi:hypothetical protein
MKKQILPLLVIAAMMVFFVSCKKESIQNTIAQSTDQVINVKISTNQSYQVNMSDASNLSISRQAGHFLTSEALIDAESGIAIYKYKPAADFTGTDEVLLLSTKTVTTYSAGSSSGCPSQGNGGSTNSSVTTTKYVTIKIAVGQ